MSGPDELAEAVRVARSIADHYGGGAMPRAALLTLLAEYDRRGTELAKAQHDARAWELHTKKAWAEVDALRAELDERDEKLSKIVGLRPPPAPDTLANALADTLQRHLGWLPLSVRYGAAAQAIGIAKAWRDAHPDPSPRPSHGTAG